jgi:hypothetical protein
MSGRNERDGARRDSREQADLRRQYRPIGIGAVAAALEATGDSADTQKTASEKQHDQQESRPPRRSYAA